MVSSCLASLAYPLAVAFSSTVAASAFVSVSSSRLVAAVVASLPSDFAERASWELGQPFLALLEPSFEGQELAYLALEVPSLVVALAYHHPSSFCEPFAVAEPSSCASFFAFTSFAVVEQPSCAVAYLHPSLPTDASSWRVGLG